MVQIVKQSHKQKVAMYMKLSKKELIAMLINCNEILNNQISPYVKVSELKKVATDVGTSRNI